MNELNEAKVNGKIETAVDACDKGWLALNLAIKAMLIKKGIKEKELPKSYRGLMYFLIKYADKETRKLFDSARNVLHICGFYDRIIIFERIEETFEEISELIKKVENK